MRKEVENPMVLAFDHEPEPIGLCAVTGNDLFEGDEYIEYEDEMITDDVFILAEYVRSHGIKRG